MKKCEERVGRHRGHPSRRALLRQRRAFPRAARRCRIDGGRRGLQKSDDTAVVPPPLSAIE